MDAAPRAHRPHATITDFVFRTNGNVVTASADTSARIWDPATGALLATLQGAHQQKLLAVAVSPDGVVATASADDTARIWTDPGSTPRLLAGHTDAVTGESYSHDGSLLLTASDDGTVRLWGTSLPTLRRLGLQQGAIRTVAYSPDGKLVLSAGADGTARLWRTDGKGALTLPQGGPVTDAAFTAGGVLTAGTDGSAKLWRVSDGALLATYPHGAPVRAAVAVADAVVTAGDDGVLRRGRRRPPPLGETHGSPITAAAASTDARSRDRRQTGPFGSGAGATASRSSRCGHTGADLVARVRRDRCLARQREHGLDSAHLGRWGHPRAHADRSQARRHLGGVQPGRKARAHVESRRRRPALEREQGTSVQR